MHRSVCGLLAYPADGKNASKKKLEIYSGGASDAKSIREKTA